MSVCIIVSLNSVKGIGVKTSPYVPWLFSNVLKEDKSPGFSTLRFILLL